MQYFLNLKLLRIVKDKMRVSEISKLIGYEFCGEDININSISYAENADDTSIAIIKSIDSINKTKAKCILVDSQ